MRWMNVSELFDVSRVGWMLLHSIWQASLIALLLGGVLFLLRDKGARLRYALACIAMAFAIIAPFVTAWWTAPVHVGQAQTIHTMPIYKAIGQDLVLIDAAGEVLEPPTLSLKQQIESYLPQLVFVWLACVTLQSIRLGVGFGRTRAWRGSSYLIVDDRWNIPLKRCINKMRLPRKVMLLQSLRVSVPMTIGWFSPVILIPTALASGLTPLQIQGILAHELAHIRRHDYLVNLIQTAIETLMFYHPAVRWIGNVIRQERENCCDDLACDIVGNPRTYAQTLIRVEELCQMRNQLTLAVTGGILLPRIQRVLGAKTRRGFYNGQSASAIAILAGLLIIGCVASREKANANEPPTTQPARNEVVEAPVAVAPTAPPKPTAPAAPTPPQPFTSNEIMQLEKARAELEASAVQRKLAEEQLRIAEENVRLAATTQPVDAKLAEARRKEVLAARERVAGATLRNQELRVAEFQDRIKSQQGNEYYISGAVSRIGVCSLSNRKITLLQAIIAAGADPTNMPDGEVQIIRRNEENKEQTMKFSVKELIENRDNIVFVQASDTILVKGPRFAWQPTTQEAVDGIAQLQKAVQRQRLQVEAISQMLGTNHPTLVREKAQLVEMEEQLRKAMLKVPTTAATQPSN